MNLRLHTFPDTLLSLGCAVTFTDGEFPSSVRKPKQALIIERSDTRNSEELAKKLENYAIELMSQQLRKDPGKQLEAMEALDNLKFELEPEESDNQTTGTNNSPRFGDSSPTV